MSMVEPKNGEYWTRAEILTNRESWIAFMLRPGRRKATGVLDAGDGERCCLGHACYSLGMRPTRTGNRLYYDDSDELMPTVAVVALGLRSDDGAGAEGEELWSGSMSHDTLTDLNDSTDWSPRQIGEYLQTKINGGGPFRPLEEFPEE